MMKWTNIRRTIGGTISQWPISSFGAAKAPKLNFEAEDNEASKIGGKEESTDIEVSKPNKNIPSWSWWLTWLSRGKSTMEVSFSANQFKDYQRTKLIQTSLHGELAEVTEVTDLVHTAFSAFYGRVWQQLGALSNSVPWKSGDVKFSMSKSWPRCGLLIIIF